MARKDRHSLIVGWMGFRINRCRTVLARAPARRETSRKSFRTAKSEVRPVFFLNPLGGDRNPIGTTR